MAVTKSMESRRAARRRNAVAARMDELQANALRVAELLKTMANPARLVILCQLADGERSVGELARTVGLSQSAISQHLAVLRKGEAVTSRRDGQTVFYSLASDDVVALMGMLHGLFCKAEPPRTAVLKPRAA
jgi:DNA-binding transcriptional ArsR family regulator